MLPYLGDVTLEMLPYLGDVTLEMLPWRCYLGLGDVTLEISYIGIKPAI